MSFSVFYVIRLALRTVSFSSLSVYPHILLWFLYIVFYDCLVFSSIVYSTLVFGCVVSRHGINFGLSNYVSPGIILSPIGMMFTRPDFFTGKVLIKVPIGDMTDTLCWLGGVV